MSIENIAGKTVRAVYENYEQLVPAPWITDEDAKNIIGAAYEKIDGAWHHRQTSRYALRFTDDSLLTLDSCGCCGGIEARVEA